MLNPVLAKETAAQVRALDDDTVDRPPLRGRRALPPGYLIALLLILLTGGWLRVSGVKWDQGTHLHPDERFLTMVAADIRRPQSLAAYFDTTSSPLNPANVGRPFFVYGTLPLFVVRAAAEIAGETGYDRIYIVGRIASAVFDLGTVALTFWLGLLLAGPRVGITASALVAFCVISIQQAHFFTVDSAATCMATLTLVMLVRVMSSGGTAAHVLFGIAFGLTLSCRINLALLGVLYGLALLHVWYAGRARLGALALAAVGAAFSTFLVFRLFQPYAFTGPGFLDLSFAQDFLRSTSTIRDLVTGAVDYPPSVQWIGRVPLLSAGTNLFLWALGPAWGLTAVAGLVWGLRRGSAQHGENLAANRIVFLWAPVLFLFHSTQFAATLRYFLPIIPVLALASAWFLGRRGASRAGVWLLTAVIAATACWSLAFTAIYQRPHTRVAASAWIYDNVAPGTTIAVEHWDDGLPLSFGGRSPSVYKHVELKLYDEENEGKRRQLLATLDAASVIVVSSNRLYGSIPRAPWRYPLARRYYELLFGNQLGFRLEKVFTSYPRIGSLQVVDDQAEEAFTVYDHPKVLVFRKSDDYSHERATSLLEAVSLASIIRVPPREASGLYRQMRPSAVRLHGEAVVRAAVDQSSMGSLAAVLRWVLALELLSLAFFALLFRPLSVGHDRGYGLAKLVAWSGCGTVMWLLASTGIASHTGGVLRGIALLALAGGAMTAWRNRREMARFWCSHGRLLIAVEAVFLVTLCVFLTVRSLNPAIFWGEKPMDFAILNANLRAASMPPPDPWFAGETLNYFYFGHALTAFFAGIAGVPAAFAFNLAIATVAGLLATAAFLFAYQLSQRIAAGLLASGAVVFIGNLAGPRLLLTQPSSALNFDYFWATSRVIQGTINEFPFWSFIFADLHAHVLAMPFEVALLYLGALWIAPATLSDRPRTLAVAGLTAWFGGVVSVTSSWSVPTIVALQLGLFATAWIQGRPTRRALGKFSLLAVGMLAMARLLFAPFWSHYVPPVRQWGWIGQESAPIRDVVTIFGVFLIATLPPLLRVISTWTRDRRWLTVLLIAGIALIGVVGYQRSTACAFFLIWAALGAWAWAAAETAALRTGALLVAAAGAVGAGTETVFVWDRMNTVFKYYLQMWLLLGCGSALLVWSWIREARHRWRLVVPVGAAAMAAIVTSVTGVIGYVRAPHASSPTPTLDGMAYLEAMRPSELNAYTWAAREIAGIPVMLEAQGPSYQAFSRVSMNTGLPTLLGWEYHLVQQGRSREEIDARARDVREIYAGEDAGRLAALLKNYRIDFVFVGPLERSTYGAGVNDKLAGSSLVEAVFKSGDVTIFAVPGRMNSAKTWIEKTPPPALPADPLGPLREPRGVALAPGGEILIADFGNRRVQRLGRDGVPIAGFGGTGEGPGQFRDPCGIAVAADGRIWVADTWNHRVQAFTADGRQISEWHAGMYGPRGIALGPGGAVYVTDTGNKRVLKFAPDGTFVEVADKDLLDNPVGIAVDRRGDLYVADAGHRRIVVLSPRGDLLREWPIDGWQSSSRMEPYLAIGPDDTVWVTDPPNHRVLLFSREGKSLGEATAASPLTLPLGIAAVDRTTAMVTDAVTNAVIKVTRPGVAGGQRQAPN